MDSPALNPGLDPENYGACGPDVFDETFEETQATWTATSNGPTKNLRYDWKDLRGPGFEAVHGDIEIMRLGPGQVLDLTVRMDKRAQVHTCVHRVGADFWANVLTL